MPIDLKELQELGLITNGPEGIQLTAIGNAFLELEQLKRET